MKNVIKSDNFSLSSLAKTRTQGHFFRSVPALTLSLIISAFLFSGCLYQGVQETKYPPTVNTVASAYSENDAGGTGLPWGVTLQVDPSVLVPYEFERVVDGDTIIVHSKEGERIRVRLTGINAPESVHPTESENTPEGKEASQFLKDLLANTDTVYLEFDEAEKDQYDRTLAYVWIDTGSTYIMVNEIMLATGYADPVYIEPNLRYADTFRQYED